MTIYELIQRAADLRGRYEVDSITPEEVGGLAEDTLAYVADIEKNMQALGIKRIYPTYDAMDADKEPVADNMLPIRFGQLVLVSESSSIYKYNGSGSWSYVAPLLSTSNTVAITLLDAMIADNNQALAAMKDTTRYVVLSGTLVVGEVHFLSDQARRRVLQVFTTNLQLIEGIFDASSTNDTTYTYIRPYGYSTALGQGWGEWKMIGNGGSAAQVVEGTLMI